MTVLWEQLTVWQVFVCAIVARFGWVFAGLVLEQLTHWGDLVWRWADPDSYREHRLDQLNETPRPYRVR